MRSIVDQVILGLTAYGALKQEKQRAPMSPQGALRIGQKLESQVSTLTQMVVDLMRHISHIHLLVSSQLRRATDIKSKMRYVHTSI